jgi:thiosulfate dehydrogenase [quinone] large subunit
LVLAWRVAGFLGVDFFVLPILGTPWAPGKLVRHPARVTPVPAAAGGRA